MPIDRPWIEHYDRGVPATLNYPRQPLFHFLEEAARKYPKRACTLFRGASISFKKMNDVTDGLAAALADLGVRKGDRVGIFMPNIPQFVMAYYGILKAGGVVVATNPQYTPTELAYQAKDSGMEIVFVMSPFHATIKTAQPSTNIKKLIITDLTEALPPLSLRAWGLAGTNRRGFRSLQSPGRTDVSMRDLIRAYPPAGRPRLEIGSDDMALFQYSGGTTGVSKAAVATHGGVVANTIQFRAWLSTLREGEETVLMAIPLFHAYGMIAGMSLGMALGASLAMVPNAREIPEMLQTINKYHPSIFPGVPTIYNAINNHPDVSAGRVDLRSLTACISGSAALLPGTKSKFEKLSGTQICEGYGLSEAPVVTHCNPLLGVNKIGSIGMPMPDVACKIVDLESGATEVASGETGELVLRGPQVMRGYHNMPAETANVLRTLEDGNTWLFTGDIVRMDADGYFYVVDRKKELIKVGGLPVWPREVEEAIGANPKVLEVGVAGIPDPHRGETVKAWIVLKPEQAADAAEIRDWCAGRLARYKIPTQVEFRSNLPKTTVGKILRRDLVKQHNELGAAQDLPAPRSGLTN